MKSYSERAEATRKKIATYKSQRRKRVLIGVVSLCSCLLIAFSFFMFVPYTTYPSGYINLNDYKNSEYFDVIKQLSYIRYGEGVMPVRKNNFQRLAESIKSIRDEAQDNAWFGPTNAGNAGSDDAPASPEGSGSPGEKYEETTDNQVAGVTEGDLLKRTNAYIYYLSVQSSHSPKLRIYPIAGTETECVAEFEISAQYHCTYTENAAEMYLNEDGTIVTLVLPMSYYWLERYKNDYYTSYNYYTEVLNIDVSDHSNIKITGRHLVSGTYVSSRMVNGELLLVTNYTVSYRADFSDEGQFIPSTGEYGDLKLIPAKNIHCPQKPSYSRYTVVCTVDAQTLEETGSEAFLSYSENVYVSADNIYLTNGYSAYYDLPLDKSHGLRGDDYHYVYEQMTEISRVEYGGELEYKGSFTVKGAVINRYCMDEKEGVLRVVTSPRRIEYVHGGNYYNHYITNGASLYCVDIENYNVVGKLENFAPVDDTVQSARFEGDKVYVCTAVVMTDPVFAIDISNYNNITFVDTGEIPGYSIALRKFYGDTLLGIGYEGTSWSATNLKIELYRETQNAVESAAVFTYIGENNEFNGHNYDYAGVTFSSQYKSYFIDAERGLIGLGIRVLVYDYGYGQYSTTYNRYILLQYDGESLNLLLDINLEGENYYFYDYTRAVYVDGTFYVFTEKGFTVTELDI